jgi:2-polyprenyl-3-methyl-5-hydroxy-6-metoxy-1,4-benzoquinol methylase
MPAASSTASSSLTFPARQREPEWMDEPDIDPRLHRQALVGLARLNWLGQSAGSIWSALRNVAQPNEPLRVLDLACGGGDVLIYLARRAQRRKLPWRFFGVDKSNVALQVARDRARARQIDVDFSSLDVLNDALPGGFDVLTCSLFLHHLTDEEALRLLSSMAAAARRAVIVSDLSRSNTNQWLTWLGCQIVTRSPVVHKDGPISIRAAFSIDEARQLASAAGLERASVRPQFPARWLLCWRRS